MTYATVCCVKFFERKFLLFIVLFLFEVVVASAQETTSLSFGERPKVGVGVILQKDGKVLLGKRKGAHGEGKWAPPGGHLEFGETIEECAKRELFEETGLRATSIRSSTWVSDVMDGTKHYITLFAFVDEFEGEVELLEPNRCEGWDFFDWEALPSPLFESVESFIAKMGLEHLKQISRVDFSLEEVIGQF